MNLLHHRHAFTLIELLVVISIIGILMSLLLPALGASRTMARKSTSAANLRSMHTGLFVSGEDNNGWYAGLDASGDDIDDIQTNVPYDGDDSTQDGDHVAARYRVLFNFQYIPPDIVISPGEAQPRQLWQGEILSGPVCLAHYSYAMLEINNDNTPAARAWRNTVDSQGIMLSDRNIATGKKDEERSIWAPEGTWNGHVVWNDGHVTTGGSKNLTTRYGAVTNENNDDLFSHDRQAYSADRNANMAKRDDYKDYGTVTYQGVAYY